MQLPTLAPGKRYTLPRPPGRPTRCCSPISRRRARPSGSCTPSSCAEPADAQRLADELPFFAPHLRVAVFPDWETLPYDSSRRTRT